jgi:hypothetical protein
MMKTQNERILRHLRDGFQITPLSALRWYGCLRLGARIWDIKKQLRKGERIMTDRISRKGKSYASYRIERAGTGCRKW